MHEQRWRKWPRRRWLWPVLLGCLPAAAPAGCVRAGERHFVATADTGGAHDLGRAAEGGCGPTAERCAAPETGTVHDLADGGCVATAELCNGLDDDCDGAVDEDGVCPADCNGRTFGGHGYAFCSAAVTWSVADQRCRSLGLRLVRVDDAAENQWITSVGQTLFSTGALYLGGSDAAQEGTFRWNDGEIFWANGKAVLFCQWQPPYQPDEYAPNEDCVELILVAGAYGGGWTPGDWNDCLCAQPDAFVCEQY